MFYVLDYILVSILHVRLLLQGVGSCNSQRPPRDFNVRFIVDPSFKL